MTIDSCLQSCPACSQPLRFARWNHRKIHEANTIWEMHLAIRSCGTKSCACHLKPRRPEIESRFALRYHQYHVKVLNDVIRMEQDLRYNRHLICRDLADHGYRISRRTVAYMLAFGRKLERDPNKVFQKMIDRIGNRTKYLILDVTMTRELCILHDFVSTSSLVVAASAMSPATIGHFVHDSPIPLRGIFSDERSFWRTIARGAQRRYQFHELKPQVSQPTDKPPGGSLPKAFYLIDWGIPESLFANSIVETFSALPDSFV